MTENLNAKLISSKQIGFFDENGVLKYYIPTPIMWDATGEGTENLCYELDEINNGNYQIIIQCDGEWIQSHQYPITIDPMIAYVQDTEQALDTYIDGDNPTTQNGLSSNLWVRSNRISYIKILGISQFQNVFINSAELRCKYYYLDKVQSGYVDVSAHSMRPAFYWDANTLTYQTASAYTNFGVAAERLSQSRANVVIYNSDGTVGRALASSPGTISFDITGAAKKWQDGSNQGIALCYESSPNLSVIIKSSECALTYRPRARYNYYVPQQILFNNAYDANFSQQSDLISDVIDELGQLIFRQVPISIDSSGVVETELDDYYQDQVGTIDIVKLAYLQSRYSDEIFNNSRRWNEILVYWQQNHYSSFCYPDSTPVSSSALAFVQNHGPNINILRLSPTLSNEYSGYEEELMLFLLAHETAHTFGLEEKYNQQGHERMLDRRCVMGQLSTHNSSGSYDLSDYYNEIITGGADLFCSSCAAELKSMIVNQYYLDAWSNFEALVDEYFEVEE